MEEIEKPHSEQIEQTNEESSYSETTVTESQNSKNDKNEDLENEKNEDEAKNKIIEDETTRLKEQPKVDSKAKNIFDKF